LGFEAWKGKKPGRPRIWSGKGYLNHKGEPLFAELVILRTLEQEGWEGVWVNNFSRTFQKGLPKVSRVYDLPVKVRKVFEQIENRNGGRGGCWDVFAWRKGEVMFAEAKRSRRDAIRPKQRAWLQAALEVGIPLSSFIIMEWTLI